MSLKITFTWIVNGNIRGFPEVDHSGIDARIVLEQNKFLTSCVQSHAFLPTELSGQVLIQGSLTQLVFVHQLTFGLRGTERI